MDKIIYIISGTLLGVLVLMGAAYFFNRELFLNATRLISNQDNGVAFNNQGVSKKLDPYRVPDSETPLIETEFWKSMAKKIIDAGETTGIRQAKIVRVINPLLEYEVEILSTGEHRTISISHQTKLQVPEYEYDESHSISSVTFRGVNRRDILNLLDAGAQIMIYAQDADVFKDSANQESVIAIELLVFAN